MENYTLVVYNPLKKNDKNNVILKTKQIEQDYSNPEKRSFVATTLRFYAEKYEGIGIASNQINLNERAFLSNNKVYFNPKVIEHYGEKDYPFSEGCLSFPGININTFRHQKIKVSYISEEGEEKTEILENLDAVVFQHELDHIDGILMPENAKSSLTQKRFWEQYKKIYKKHIQNKEALDFSA